MGENLRFDFLVGECPTIALICGDGRFLAFESPKELPTCTFVIDHDESTPHASMKVDAMIPLTVPPKSKYSLSSARRIALTTTVATKRMRRA
jgi:hypothetical protein